MMKGIRLAVLLICMSAVSAPAALSSHIFAYSSSTYGAVGSASSGSDIISSPWDDSYISLRFSLVMDGITSITGTDVIAFANDWAKLPIIPDYTISNPPVPGAYTGSALGRGLRPDAPPGGP